MMLRVMNRRAIWQMMCIGLLGCISATNGADKTKIELDGDATDWKSVKPVIEDARSPVVGNDKKIDVHQLKAWHDDKYLYLYVSTTMPPKDAIGEDEASSIFVVYIDADGDEKTGCKGVKMFGGDGRTINGYDIQLVAMAGHGKLGSFSKKKGHYARVKLYAPGEGNRGFSFSKRKELAEEDSYEKGAPLKLCPSGIEFKLSLEKHKIKRGATLRFMTSKQGNVSQAKFAEGVYKVGK